jgi:DNA recombination protein RmuC
MDFTIVPVLILIISILNLIILGIVLLKSGKGSDDSSAGVREELRVSREEGARAARDLREEVNNSLRQLNDTLINTMKGIGDANEATIDKVRRTLDERVRELQESNEKKLEEMRKTVDEKLHETLEKRLGESFKQVSDRLEAVHLGLGEMRTLATGVGDLKRVLTNVKTRGTWAEVQLGALLDQILHSSQFERNVKVKPSSDEIVEFAVKLPGPEDDKGRVIWLPIDSKFPQEDYVRLQEAAELGDVDEVKRAEDALVRAIKAAARDISNKYIDPPNTTDFAIMFLGTEGLYSEALRVPGLVESIQSEFRVVIAGPTTIAAILNSLRMGFQALAFEKRASEVWRVLGAVKTEFGKFGEVLDKMGKQLKTVEKTLGQTSTRTRAIQRKLVNVEQLPESDSASLLGIDEELGLLDGVDIPEDDSESDEGSE